MAITKKIKIVVDATSAKKAIDDLAKRMTSLTGSTGKLSTAQNRHTQSQHKLNKSIVNTNRSLNAMGGLLRKLAAAATIFTGIRLADDFNELQNKLRITLHGAERLLDVQQKLVDVSLATRSSLQANALLYLRLSEAVDRTVVSQTELFRITETVGKAIQIGGSSAQEAQGALRQFTQIISAGFTTGFSQELNSIAEQTPGLFRILVDGLRETSEEFRELEATGISGIKILKIFSEKGIGDLPLLLSALATQADAVDKKFQNVNITVSKAFGNVRNSLEVYIGAVDDATGLTNSLALAINDIALNFDEYAVKLIAATAAMVSAIVTFKLLTAVITATTAAVIALKGAFTAVAASKGLLSLAKMAARGGAIFLLKAAIIAASVAVGFMVAKFIKVEDGLFRVGEKTASFGEIMRATFVVIKRRIKLFSENMGIMSDNVEIVMGNVGKIIVGTFEQIGIALDSEESSFAKFFLKQVPSFLKDMVNAIIITFKVLGSAIGGFFLNIIKDSEGFIKKIALNAEKIALEASVKGAGFIKKGINAILPSPIFGELSEKDRETLKKIKEIDEQIESINKNAFNFGDAFSEQVEEIVFTDFVGDFLSTGVTLGTSVGNGVKFGFSAVLENLKTFTSDFFSDVEDEIEETINRPGLRPRPLGPDRNEQALIDRTMAAIEARQEIRLTFLEYKKFAEFIASDGSLTFMFDKVAIGFSKIKTDIAEFFSPSFWKENLKLIADTFENTFLAITGLFSALSDIRQDKLDEELRTSTTLSDEERKTKESNAKAAFENSKKLTLAGIALSTGLAIMNALAQPTPNFLINAANAAAAAATGATQYAKANAQQYKAPSPPSGANISAASGGTTTNQTLTTININAGGATAGEIADSLQNFINNNDGIIINSDSAQARELANG